VRGRTQRGRRPWLAGSDEWLPGFGVPVVGLSSTTSTTSVRPVGIGPSMNPGRMGICPSDSRRSTSFVRRGMASCPRELEIVPRCLRVVAARTPGLEPGASSLSGFCIRSCFPRIAPATWVNDVPLETAANRSVSRVWTKRGPTWCGGRVARSRPVRIPVALRFSATRDRSAGRARQGQCQARGWRCVRVNSC
jgi:hypothetical protein